MSFDYAKWVDVARDFNRQLSEVFDLEFEISIAPKLSCSEIKQLQRLVGKLPQGAPPRNRYDVEGCCT